MQRIQRKRIKGFKMPGNTVYVGRPTKWGNPVKLKGNIIYINASYRGESWVYYSCGDIDDVLHLYWHILKGTQFHNLDLHYWSSKFRKNDIEELIGKNLACFCSLCSKCHADILIDFISETQRK